MRIERIQIKNFKCFADSGDIRLSPTFNIFVGQNDSGKSALLDALVQNQPAAPHRSVKTVPKRDGSPPDISIVDIDYRVGAGELQALCKSRRSLSIAIAEGGRAASVDRLAGALQTGGLLVSTFRSGSFPRGWLDTIGRPIDPDHFAQVTNVASPSDIDLGGQGEVRGNVQDLGHELAAMGQRSIYLFKAERLNVGECAIGGQTQLASNAANLPDVLNQLSTRNPAQFDRLMRHVRTVFPHISQVTAPAVSGSSVRIFVWTLAPDLERDDLAVPLGESGTGIGQVLAMLYVAVTSTEPRIIAIDEPQSFLHPGAVRKLFEILRGYPHHQYILTTHSPVALAIQDTDSIFLVKRGENGSTVAELDADRQHDMQVFLSEVGARLGDVFGADTILWVEGATEELCFPMIIREIAGRRLEGVQVLGVLSTDELAARHAGRVWEIYSRLTTTNSLLPPAIAFVFDREGRTVSQRQDIDRTSRGMVRWLPRRMYENYLLDPAAIANVICAEAPEVKATVDIERVSAWLASKTNDAPYVPAGGGKYPGTDWQVNVDGARVLRDVFSDLSLAKLCYSKVKHGKALTRFAIDQSDKAIHELASYLSELLP